MRHWKPALIWTSTYTRLIWKFNGSFQCRFRSFFMFFWLFFFRCAFGQLRKTKWLNGDVYFSQFVCLLNFVSFAFIAFECFVQIKWPHTQAKKRTKKEKQWKWAHNSMSSFALSRRLLFTFLFTYCALFISWHLMCSMHVNSLESQAQLNRLRLFVCVRTEQYKKIRENLMDCCRRWNKCVLSITQILTSWQRDKWHFNYIILKIGRISLVAFNLPVEIDFVSRRHNL